MIAVSVLLLQRCNGYAADIDAVSCRRGVLAVR
jgi:hypothetical protein